jgi:hypothetical protein
VNLVSLPNGVACSESVFDAELCCLQQISVHCEKLAFTTEIVWSAAVLPTANQFSLPKLCGLQRCCLQRISFRYQIVLSAANEFSLLNGVACSKSVFAIE